MRKLLVGFLVVLILALVGGVGYLLLNEDILGEAVEVGTNASSSEAASGSPDDGTYRRRIGDTAADMREALVSDYQKNRDTVGWLQVAGTDINDSVVQAHDNLYYLRRTQQRKESVYGCYYADYECSFGDRTELSQNTVIYGHSDLKDNSKGPKFSQLFHFADEEFARKTPEISFTTLEEGMRWEVFAAFYTDTSFNYISADYASNAFVALISEARERSLYDYAAEVGPEDKILTLSTCAVKYGADENQRFVVMARLLPVDHPAQSRAELSVNPDPRLPGA